jgi:hypothetical protein
MFRVLVGPWPESVLAANDEGELPLHLAASCALIRGAAKAGRASAPALVKRDGKVNIAVVCIRYLRIEHLHNSML